MPEQQPPAGNRRGFPLWWETHLTPVGHQDEKSSDVLMPSRSWEISAKQLQVGNWRTPAFAPRLRVGPFVQHLRVVGGVCRKLAPMGRFPTLFRSKRVPFP